MSLIKEIEKRIFELGSVTNEHEFNLLSLDVFRHQLEHNTIYSSYVLSLNKNSKKIEHYSQIPILPM